jgi:hypothetical protein
LPSLLDAAKQDEKEGRGRLEAITKDLGGYNEGETACHLRWKGRIRKKNKK